MSGPSPNFPNRAPDSGLSTNRRDLTSNQCLALLALRKLKGYIDQIPDTKIQIQLLFDLGVSQAVTGNPGYASQIEHDLKEIGESGNREQRLLSLDRRAELLGHLSSISLGCRDAPRGLKLLEQAIGISQKLPAPNDRRNDSSEPYQPDYISSMSKIAYILWLYGNDSALESLEPRTYAAFSSQFTHFAGVANADGLFHASGALSYLVKGNFSGAIQHIHNLVEQESISPAQQTQMYLIVARTALDRGDRSCAEDVLKEAKKSFAHVKTTDLGDYVDCVLNMIDIMIDLRHYEDAEGLCDKCIANGFRSPPSAEFGEPRSLSYSLDQIFTFKAVVFFLTGQEEKLPQVLREMEQHLRRNGREPMLGAVEQLPFDLYSESAEELFGRKQEAIAIKALKMATAAILDDRIKKLPIYSEFGHVTNSGLIAVATNKHMLEHDPYHCVFIIDELLESEEARVHCRVHCAHSLAGSDKPESVRLAHRMLTDVAPVTKSDIFKNLASGEDSPSEAKAIQDNPRYIKARVKAACSLNLQLFEAATALGLADKAQRAEASILGLMQVFDEVIRQEELNTRPTDSQSLAIIRTEQIQGYANTIRAATRPELAKLICKLTRKAFSLLPPNQELSIDFDTGVVDQDYDDDEGVISSSVQQTRDDDDRYGNQVYLCTAIRTAIGRVMLPSSTVSFRKDQPEALEQYL